MRSEVYLTNELCRPSSGGFPHRLRRRGR